MVYPLVSYHRSGKPNIDQFLSRVFFTGLPHVFVCLPQGTVPFSGPSWIWKRCSETWPVGADRTGASRVSQPGAQGAPLGQRWNHRCEKSTCGIGVNNYIQNSVILHIYVSLPQGTLIYIYIIYIHIWIYILYVLYQYTVHTNFLHVGTWRVDL